MRWFRQAARQGDADARVALGAVHSIGEGISKNAVKDARWIRRAAVQGHAEARRSLGAVLCLGLTRLWYGGGKFREVNRPRSEWELLDRVRNS